MENKIVLGYPYAGAFWWLLNAERQYQVSIKDQYPNHHEYYIGLFGTNHNKIIDETISLALLFDEIYLSPADLSFDENYNKLGIYTDWAWLRNIDIKDRYDFQKFLLTDSQINNYLRELNYERQDGLLREAISQVHISNKFDTAIFAIPSYQKLCERINQLLYPNKSSLKIQETAYIEDAVNSIFEVASIDFSIKKVEEFVMLKQDKNIQKYAQSFRKYIKSLPDGSLDESFLYRAMLEAMNNQSLSNHVVGGLKIISTVTQVISLTPNMGLPFGLAGLGVDFFSKIVENSSNKNKWWLLAPEISQKLNKQRIEDLYHKLINKL